jgi:hypothetical protein
MLMEAVLESLKDLEMRPPHAGEPPGVSASSLKPSHKDDQDASPSEHGALPLETESTSVLVSAQNLATPLPLKKESTSVLVNAQNLATPLPLKTESTSVLVNAQNLATPDTNAAAGSAFDAPSPGMETGTTGTSARSDTSASTHSSSDADMSANTKATLTVERNPASHIMDGLMRRWDLNFFRNSNNR